MKLRFAISIPYLLHCSAFGGCRHIYHISMKRNSTTGMHSKISMKRNSSTGMYSRISMKRNSSTGMRPHLQLPPIIVPIFSCLNSACQLFVFAGPSPGPSAKQCPHGIHFIWRTHYFENPRVTTGRHF